MAANTLDHLRRVDEEAGERLRMQPRDVIPLEEGVGQQLPVRVQLEVVRLENMHLRDADRIEIMQQRSEEHTSELQSLMRTSYAVFCLKKKKRTNTTNHSHYKHTKYKNYN